MGGQSVSCNPIIGFILFIAGLGILFWCTRRLGTEILIEVCFEHTIVYLTVFIGLSTNVPFCFFIRRNQIEGPGGGKSEKN